MVQKLRNSFEKASRRMRPLLLAGGLVAAASVFASSSNTQAQFADTSFIVDPTHPASIYQDDGYQRSGTQHKTNNELSYLEFAMCVSIPVGAFLAVAGLTSALATSSSRKVESRRTTPNQTTQ